MGIEKTKRFVYLALFSAMAIVLSMIESIYIGPIFFMVRIGLANIVALVTVKILGVKEMIIVNTMRVVISTLMRGMIFSSTFWISLGGVVLSSDAAFACGGGRHRGVRRGEAPYQHPAASERVRKPHLLTECTNHKFI